MGRKRQQVTPTEETPAEEGIKPVTQVKGAEQGTSRKLFAHLYDQEKPQEETKAEPTAEAAGEVQQEAQEPQETKDVETPEKEAKDLEEFLDLNQFSKRKLKLKTESGEEEATLDDVVRRVQSDKTITQRFQKIAEERRKLAEERSEIERLRAQKATAQQNPEPSAPAEEQAAYIKALNQKIGALENAYRQLATGVTPML